jgi:ATP-independent RNA helicase DbpA
MDKKQQIIDDALRNAGFTALNELQKEVVQFAGKKEDLLLLSQTGSGKTLAFLLPILFDIDTTKNYIQVLIMAPTRELALQIETVFRSLKTNHKVLTVYGGHSLRIERNSLSEAPYVLIGTPGRICDHIAQENLDLSKVKHLVIDEYDKCLEFGFEDQIRYINEELNSLKFTTLVSATRHKEFTEYLKFNDPQIVDHLEKGEKPDITFLSYPVTTNTKFERLFDLLCSFNGELAIVFCNFREATESVRDYLSENGYDSIVYHGGLEQEERERALIKFRNGSCHTLICTDLGSRGLDIPEIQHVVHFQYPQSEEAFIHRNGRTARMKANGSAYLMINRDENTPEYLQTSNSEYKIPNDLKGPEDSPWITIYFSGGKKDKINKIDLVGFLGQKGGLKKEEIGLITVLDHSSYVAISRKNVRAVLQAIPREKIKGKKLRIAIAK